MIGLILLLVVVGVAPYIPMSPPIKVVLRVVVVLALVLYLLRIFGVDVAVPRIR